MSFQGHFILVIGKYETLCTLKTSLRPHLNVVKYRRYLNMDKKSSERN